MTHGDRRLCVTRWMQGIDAPPFWAAQLRRPGKVDRWQIIHFEAPSTVEIDVGVRRPGPARREGDRSKASTASSSTP